MKVFTCFWKFHAFDQLRNSIIEIVYIKFLQPFPTSPTEYGIKDNQIISFPIFEVFSRIRFLIPNLFLNSYLKYLSIIFDFICSLYINKDIDLFIDGLDFQKSP